MNKTIYKRSLIVIMTMLLTFFQSCDFDQVESNYSDYASADKDGLFEKGWIPVDLTFKSMTEIYQKTNLDLNTCIFSFKLSKTDIESVKKYARPTNSDFEKPKRIGAPSDWTESVEKLDHFVFITPDKSDSVYLAIDDKDGKIYGWRNYRKE